MGKHEDEAREKDLHRPLDSDESLEYMQEEIGTRVELGLVDSILKITLIERARELLAGGQGGETKSVLSLRTDAFMDAVNDCDRAAKHAVAVALSQATAAREELGAALGTQANAPVSLSVVTGELGLRAIEARRISARQQACEDERQLLIEQLATERHAGAKPKVLEDLNAQIARLNAGIDTLIKATEQNARDCKALRAYVTAVTLVAKGLPPDLIGRSTIPGAANRAANE